MSQINLLRKLLTLTDNLINNIPNIYCMTEDIINTRNAYYFFAMQKEYIDKIPLSDESIAGKIFNFHFLMQDFLYFEKLTFKSISLYETTTSTTIVKWEDVTITNEDGKYYLLSGATKIDTEIIKNIKNVEMYTPVDLRIQVNDKTKEFTYLTNINGIFSLKDSQVAFKNSKSSFLNKFPNEFRLLNYELNFNWIFTGLSIAANLPLNVKENNGLISKIEAILIGRRGIFTLLQSKRENAKMKFKKFDVSILTSKVDEEKPNVPEYTMLFESPGGLKVEECKCELFSVLNIAGEKSQIISELELEKTQNNYEFKIKSQEIPTYEMIQIQDEGKHLKFTLNRPKNNIKTNSMKNVESLTIKCLSGNVYQKPVELTLTANDLIKEDHIETSFSLKRPSAESECEYVLYNILKSQIGFLEIKINGENEIIGTYGIWLPNKGVCFAIYSSQLINIPFPPCELKQKYEMKIYESKTKEANKNKPDTHLSETKDKSTKVMIFFIIFLGTILIAKGILFWMTR